MGQVNRELLEAAAGHETELNARQREVLALVAAGRTNAEIARQLGMTFDGAKWNISEILSKLGLASREEAAEYWRWRNRSATRIEYLVRSLVALSPAKLAAGGGALTAVAVAVAVIWLFATSSNDARGRGVPPFYLEAVVTAFDASLPDAATGASAPPKAEVRKSLVRWWHRDRDHARWEVETVIPVLDAGETTVFTADGATGWFLLKPSNVYKSEPLEQLPPGTAARSAGVVILIGPAPAKDIPSLLAELQTWQDSEGRAEVVGHEDVLGRPATVIEYGHSQVYDRGDGTRVLTGLKRMWVDPATMQILRHETDNGRFVAEVTRLDEGIRVDDDLVRFDPPPGSRDAKAVTPDAARDLSSRGVGTPPPGALVPRYLPRGFALAGSGETGDWQGAWTQELWFGVPGATRKDAIPLVITQKPRADGVPVVLQQGRPVDVNGAPGWVNVAGDGVTVAFARDGIAVVVTGRGLAEAEILRGAESMERAP